MTTFFGKFFAWLLKKSLMLSLRMAMKPAGLMGMVLFGLVACSSDHGSRDYADYGSPYGGSNRPTDVKLGKPYEINGETYYPKYDPDYDATGKASWYGPGFHGRMTANGERYDQHDMTAAHKTLPLPSLVRVTRTDTGESVIVRINDRGPFASGRIIDLSRAAAEEINMLGVGVAPVRVTYLERETKQYLASVGIDTPEFMEGNKVTQYASNEASAPSYASYHNNGSASAKADVIPKEQNFALNVIKASKEGVETYVPHKIDRQDNNQLQSNSASRELTGGNGNDALQARVKPVLSENATAAVVSGGGNTFRVQTAAFSSKDNAQRHAEELSGIAKPLISQVENENGLFYRVSLAPVNDYKKAVVMLEKTKEMGYKDARIMVE